MIRSTWNRLTGLSAARQHAMDILSELQEQQIRNKNLRAELKHTTAHAERLRQDKIKLQGTILKIRDERDAIKQRLHDTYHQRKRRG